VLLGAQELPCSVPLTEMNRVREREKKKEREQSDSALFFFFFFFYNPVTWSLMVSLEISSIKPLFCLPKEFFQTQPHPPQGFTTLHD